MHVCLQRLPIQKLSHIENELHCKWFYVPWILFSTIEISSLCAHICRINICSVRRLVFVVLALCKWHSQYVYCVQLPLAYDWMCQLMHKRNISRHVLNLSVHAFSATIAIDFHFAGISICLPFDVRFRFVFVAMFVDCLWCAKTKKCKYCTATNHISLCEMLSLENFFSIFFFSCWKFNPITLNDWPNTWNILSKINKKINRIWIGQKDYSINNF